MSIKMLLFKTLFVVFLFKGLQAQNQTEIDDNLDEDNGPTTKIVGGQQAAAGAYPFMASLRRTGSRNSHFCGGTILNSRFILTAAHCVSPSTQASQVTVFVGTNTITSGGVPYKVSKIIIHSGYNTDIYINDIALLQLETSLAMTNTIKAVTRRSSRLNDNSVYNVVAVGWGYLSSTKPTVSNTLQYVNLQTRTRAQCKSIWKNFGNNQICTVYPSKGVCSGDSGGPLLYNGQQIGITSYGSSGGCATNVPDVYTEVANYAAWITSNTNLS